MASNKTYYIDISILRVVSIIIVVFFHVYGMMYAEHFPETKQLYYDTYYIVNQCIFINIGMPMFVFISGFLFQSQLNSGKYSSICQLLKKKSIRILLPYVIFGLIMMATTGNFHPIQLLSGGYWHLWFLPMLFWCFLISYGLTKLKLKSWLLIILLTIFYILSLCHFDLPGILGTQFIPNWYCWFLLGSLCFIFQNQICEFILRYRLSMPLLIVYLVPTIIHPVEYGDRTWFSIISQISILLLIWSFLHERLKNTAKKYSFFTYFSKYCFGIFIFHNWVALYLVSKTSQRLFNLPVLASEHIVLFPLCLTIITFIVSYFASWILLKTKVGKFLIG